jgi:hypothetical protein
MQSAVSKLILKTLRGVLTSQDLRGNDQRILIMQLCVIAVALFPYGFTIGVWRDPLQGLYSGIKFPLVVVLVTLMNGVINGILGKLYGANLSLLESMRSIAASYVIAGLLLGSLAPVFLFLALSAPPLTTGGVNEAYGPILLGHVSAIAVAGVVANVRLYGLIQSVTDEPADARRVLAAWIFLSMIVGCQLCWNLRPFIGSPDLPLQFLRPNAFEGNFYEAVWNQLVSLVG